jgi:hypothetical protein
MRVSAPRRPAREIGAPLEVQDDLALTFRRRGLDPGQPGTALTACSIGRVISSSISSGPTPVVGGSHGQGRLLELGHEVDRQPRQRNRAESVMTPLIMNMVTGRWMARRGMLHGVARPVVV